MSHASNRSAIDVFLAKLLAHSVLTREEQEELRALPASRVEVSANRDFVRIGDKVSHVCLVERGLMGRFEETQDGKRQFVSLHIPGEIPDLRSLMVPKADTALNALAKSTVLRVPLSRLSNLEKRYPAIAAAFSRDCVLQSEIMAQWLVNVGRRDSRTRMSHLLCEMALRYGYESLEPALRYELPMTQEQLGDALALTPVHVNRTLGSLRDDGIVVFAKGVVEIPDWSALANVGEFDPAYLHLEPGRPNT